MSDHVFICYAREDEAFVLQLAEKLKGRRVPVWLDQWDIPPGADWDRSIDNAIYECGKFIIVLSSKSVESTEVRGELHTALHEHKPIIPVIHSTCRVPRQLLTIQHVDFTSRGADDQAALRQLLRTLESATVIEAGQQAEATDKAVREDEQGRAKAEAKRKAELEEQRRIEEERNRVQQEAERRRLEAEAQRKAEEERLREEERKRPGKVFRDKLKDGSEGPEMVVVPTGTFKMGDIQGKGNESEKPVHTVNIAKPFALGLSPVTFKEYDRFAQAT